MPSVHALQSVMNKGELTPKLHSRVDSPYYRLGLKACRNFYPLVQGGVTKRSGTKYVTNGLLSGSTDPGLLIEFIFSETQAYVLEFGNRKLGFLYQGGVVETSPGVRYTITTPYTSDDLAALDFVQSADVIYFVHPDFPIYKLQRFGEVNWTLTPFTPKDGPWLDVNIKDNPALAEGLARPAITVTGTTTSDGSNTNLLNSSTTSFARWNTASPVVTYELTAGARICNAYELKGANPGWDAGPARFVTAYPRKWKFLGSNDGSTWEVLDSRQAEADWQAGEERAYYFENEKAFSFYRLDIEARNGDKDFTILGSLRLSFKGVTGTLTFDNNTNVNEGNGFTSDDIGRQIRWQGDDGYWRIITLTGPISPSYVTGTWDGFWLWESGVKSKNWQLGAFSEYTGYPTTATIFQERLCFAGTKFQPRTVFMSASGDYEDFAIPDPLTDDAPITVTIAGAQQDRIEWLRETEDLLMIGTTDGIASLGGTEDKAVSATNIQQRKHTGFGTAPKIQPARVGSVLVFTGFHRNTLHELIYSAQNNGYDAPNMAVLADHIYKDKVRDLVFSQTPHDLMFMPLDTGDVATMTYERAQEVVGNAVFEFPNGKVLSVAVVPEEGRDALYLLVERVIDGVTKQYVERLEKPFDYGTDADAWFLDCALAYSGPQEDVITGLSHLEGQTVAVYGWDDTDDPSGEPLPIFQNNYTVIGGQINLTQPVTYAVIGLEYEARIRTLPHVMDANDGTTMGRAKRVDSVSVSLLNSRAISVRGGGSPDGTQPTLEEVLLRGFSDSMDSYVPLFTGIMRVPIDDTWESDGELEFISREPQPATILAVTSMIDWEPGNSRRQGG